MSGDDVRSSVLRVAVAIATAGRREELTETVRFLLGQKDLPDSVYICPAAPDDADLPAIAAISLPTYVVTGERGSAAQRNAILRAVNGEDIILFIDDDYLPAPDYIHELREIFAAHADIAVLTGHVVADGAHGPGIAFAEAATIIADLPSTRSGALLDIHGAYGCNMAVRLSALQRSGVRFDERLPLYGWWEDIDFSSRLRPYGRIVRTHRLLGVHLGSKRGRSPGTRIGYSQVANILYLARKGSVPWRIAAPQIVRNVLANLVRRIRPEPWIDRRGRFAGNMLAFAHACLGRIDPGYILKL